jgi:two-component sensor histidine kinase
MADFDSSPATQRALLEAIDQLASAIAIEDIAEAIRATARRLIGADGIALILREGNNCLYAEEDAIGPLWKGQTFPMSACISGWAMLNKQTALVPDIYADPRVPHELYESTFVRSLAMAPVRSADPIGALGAYWNEIREHRPREIEILEALAQATATAIENVRLIGALSRALKDAELARDELRHRLKNAYTAIQGLADLTLPVEHSRVLSARIAALARAHELLDHKLAHQETIGIRELLEAELEPYQSDSPGRLVTTGPEVALSGRDAVALGLAVNELATNALKYGALSGVEGSVEVDWRVEENHLVLQWNENDGPEVKAHALENFGSRLLRRLIEGQLRGSIRRELARKGAICIIEIPLIHSVQDIPASKAVPELPKA